MDLSGIQSAIERMPASSGIQGPTDGALIPQVAEDSIVLTPTTRRNIRKILPPYTGLKNLLLVGDAGVGKNAILYYLNTLRKHPLIRYSFNGDTLAEELIGSYRLEVGQTNKFVWVDGPLTAALRGGYTFVADEMNLAAPEVLKRFSSVFEHGYLDIVEGSGERVHAAPGFSYIATQNPTEGFEGRKALPREIQKYFYTVYLDSYDGSELTGILSKLYSDLPETLLGRIVAVNMEMEHLLQLRKLGSADLERYHFNLRNMNVLCRRLLRYAQAEKFNPIQVGRELEYVYLYPFRKEDDRRLIKAVILKYIKSDFFNEFATKEGQDPTQIYLWPEQTLSALSSEYDELIFEENCFRQNNRRIEDEDSVTPSAAPPIVIKDGSLSIGSARTGLNGHSEKEIDTLLGEHALLNKDLSLMSVLLSAIEGRENVLLEGGPEIEAERVIELLTGLLGKKLTVIYFSKGMHTSDILGGLKPMPGKDGGPTEIRWLDGPLSAAIRRGDFILFKGLEAAGAEIIEKLNMLTDDARAITLPPESDETEPLKLHEDSVIFALKYHRTSQSKPTISRAFRNRFCAVNLEPDYPAADLAVLVDFHLDYNLSEGYTDLGERMAVFHIEMQKRAKKRKIGADRIDPYHFGFLNYHRWNDGVNGEIHRLKDILHFNDEIEMLDQRIIRDALTSYLKNKKASNPDGEPTAQDRKKERYFQMFCLALYNAAEAAYISEISSAKDKEHIAKMFSQVFANMDVNVDWELVALNDKEQDGVSLKKKSKIDLQKPKIWWDQKKHFREANTGKAKRALRGRDNIKKGVEIDTPETGGETKEGPDAWYGQDTMGNKGQGPVGGGGGAYGYRTEELYQNFLKKRKPLWEYDIGVSLADFNETFGPEIERISIDFDRLFEPEVDIVRQNRQNGFKVDARKYMKYLSGKGDDKIFDNTTISINDDKLKGVEIVFAVNKGRRLFNFNYAIATLVSIMCSARILHKHKLPMTVFGYSDKTNMKKDVDLETFTDSKLLEYGPVEEERLFGGLSRDWFGDTVAEGQILEAATDYFSSDVQTPIIVMVSDFRGPRAKKHLVDELNSLEVLGLHKKVDELSKRGYVILGVQVGVRSIAEHLFSEYIEVDEDNYADMPSLMATKLTNIILKYKKSPVF